MRRWAGLNHRPICVDCLDSGIVCENLGKAFARQHGHQVVNCYADIGRTRPTLHALIEEAKAQKFGAVFVFGLSRISRNPSDFTRDAEALHEAGCVIYDASTGAMYEPENVAARFALNVQSVLAELDAEGIDRERGTRRALTR